METQQEYTNTDNGRAATPRRERIAIAIKNAVLWCAFWAYIGVVIWGVWSVGTALVDRGANTDRFTFEQGARGLLGFGEPSPLVGKTLGAAVQDGKFLIKGPEDKQYQQAILTWARNAKEVRPDDDVKDGDEFHIYTAAGHRLRAKLQNKRLVVEESDDQATASFGGKEQGVEIVNPDGQPATRNTFNPQDGDIYKIRIEGGEEKLVRKDGDEWVSKGESGYIPLFFIAIRETPPKIARGAARIAGELFGNRELEQWADESLKASQARQANITPKDGIMGVPLAALMGILVGGLLSISGIRESAIAVSKYAAIAALALVVIGVLVIMFKTLGPVIALLVLILIALVLK